MKALLSSMAALALIVSGTAWAGETGETEGSQVQRPSSGTQGQTTFKSSETYTPHEASETTDPGTTEQSSQDKQTQQTTGPESEQSAAGRYVDDAMITTKIKAALAQSPGTSAIAISVETNNGTVQLTGSVKSDEEKIKAESIARSVDGVKEVENRLMVEG